MIAMYLGLLGLEHGVDPKSAFTSVSMKPLSYRSLLIMPPKFLGDHPEFDRHHWPCGTRIRLRHLRALESPSTSFGVPVLDAAHDVCRVRHIDPYKNASN